MNQTENNFTNDLENVIMDFLLYRKAQKENGQNQVNFYNMETVPTFAEESKPAKQPPKLNKPNEEKMNERQHYIHLIYNDINDAVAQAINRVLDGMQYPGSPLYDQYIDRETLAQIGEKIVKELETYPQVQEILQEHSENPEADKDQNVWTRYNLLKSIVQLQVLMEMIAIRNKNNVNWNYIPMA